MRIISIVSDYYKITIIDMFSCNRDQEIMKAVHISMYFCGIYTGLSQIAIAKLFKRSNHSTYCHAIKSVRNQYETNNIYKYDIDAIDKLIHPEDRNNEELEPEEIFMENDFYIEAKFTNSYSNKEEYTLKPFSGYKEHGV